MYAGGACEYLLHIYAIGLSVKFRNDATRLLDYQNPGSGIPWVEAQLPEPVEPPACEVAEVERGRAVEMFRVLKPGGRYACSEYLLTPHFDWDDPEHVRLHRSYLPTLAATQSMYPADVCAALERAGFEVLVSAPSRAPAWPICEQKRDLILHGRRVIRALEAARIAPPWVEESLELLQSGGEAWTLAEKAKIADLNWRIVAEKPRAS